MFSSVCNYRLCWKEILIGLPWRVFRERLSICASGSFNPYKNYGLITAGVLLDIDRNFVFLLEYYSTWKMMKIPP